MSDELRDRLRNQRNKFYEESRQRLADREKIEKENEERKKEEEERKKREDE